jgi:hypothetical protein
MTPGTDIAVAHRGTWTIILPQTARAHAHLAALATDLEGPVLGLPVRGDGRWPEYVCTRSPSEVLGGLRNAGFTCG